MILVFGRLFLARRQMHSNDMAVCQRKLKYENYKRAAAEAVRMAAAHPGTKYKAYRCPVCDYWHVGRPKPKAG